MQSPRCAFSWNSPVRLRTSTIMAKLLLLSALILAASIWLSDGRRVSRSELRSSLRAHGVPADQLATWECIVEHESQFKTDAHNRQTGDHGIFQISEIYWCSPPGTGCGVTCESLRDDDINKDIECALKVFREHTRLQGNGFRAWTTYEPYCLHTFAPSCPAGVFAGSY